MSLDYNLKCFFRLVDIDIFILNHFFDFVFLLSSVFCIGIPGIVDLNSVCGAASRRLSLMARATAFFQ